MAMSREQKIAKARALRGDGWTLKRVGNYLGVSHPTVRRWTDDEVAERHRQACREYKDRNREAVRKQNREYKATLKAECPQCGGEMGRKTAERNGKCRACHADERDRRARQIERWWAEGLSCREIAVALEWSTGSVARELHLLRERGYDLPYRYRPGRRNARRFPEQVPV